MESPGRPDLLTDETVNEIIGVFEVDHVFPTTYIKEEADVQPMGWWGRIKAFFGFRRGAPPEVRGERGDDPEGGL